LDELTQIAEQFNPNGPVVDVKEYGTGNVNDTYLVTLEAPGGNNYFIMQRINQRVFHQPELIMLNMATLSEHVRSRLEQEARSGVPARRWETPRIYYAKDGRNYQVTEDGSFWRAMSFINHSTAYPRIRDAHHATEAGYALGRFQSLISDMQVSELHDTLVGFHITPRYLRHYDEVLARDNAQRGVDMRSANVRFCTAFVEKHRKVASVLEDAKVQGELPIRPMHGDPKIDNIMIDNQSSQAVSIIDLDTVKPGLVHYDIGDCLRSCCNLLGEETDDLPHVKFELDLCREILRGYLSVASAFFRESDYAYLFDAIRLIAFELGLRFYTDYLEGNVYFKARHREHNLQRALVQFKLTESIEAQETGLCAIIREVR
jgi:Ser/Thr protein kinase RdoA (MazF antagonist)